MICANPDLVVHRGHKLVYCAGALAELYEALGGETIYAGKPHRPIYTAALERIAALRGAPVAPARALAIGDALRTDLAGAAAAGLDALFVADGIHRDELYGPGAPTTRCSGCSRRRRRGRSPPSARSSLRDRAQRRQCRMAAARRSGHSRRQAASARSAPPCRLWDCRPSISRTSRSACARSLRKTVESEDVIGFAELTGRPQSDPSLRPFRPQDPLRRAHRPRPLHREPDLGGDRHAPAGAGRGLHLADPQLPRAGENRRRDRRQCRGDRACREGRRVRLKCECRVDGKVVLDGEGVLSVPKGRKRPAP